MLLLSECVCFAYCRCYSQAPDDHEFCLNCHKCMMHVRVYQKAVGANAHALNIRDLTYYDCAANVYETASDRLQFMVQRVQRTLHVG